MIAAARLAVLAVMLACLAGGAAAPSFAQHPEDPAHETDDAFRAYVESLWPDIRAAGISRPTFDRALAEIHVDWRVLERANYQPEHEFAIGDYLARLASDARIHTGRELLDKHGDVFRNIEAAYGVDRHVLAAIWGIESNFGAGMGEHGVIRALGMLAWKGERRVPFGKQQLIAALRIVDRGDIEPARMLGSWAGAMGHTQFIPTTYNLHAVDFDKDGRRDIWGSIPDALASTANYLKVSGWRTGFPWGFEVALPAGFDLGLLDRELPMADWARRSVEHASQAYDSRLLPAGPAPRPVSDPAWAAMPATLRLPTGAKGPAFLVTGNFRAILKYNNAISYALAVGHLADRLAGGNSFTQAWPADDRPLRRREREDLQGFLLAKGYYKGEIDGLIGDQTKAALIAWQRTAGVVPDGYASDRMLELLRGKPGSLAGAGAAAP
jgi:membrane-bound lytic murein transglycosylase B